MTTKGIYNTLVTQLDKLARHNRQGSFRTKDRYYEAVKRFCAIPKDVGKLVHHTITIHDPIRHKVFIKPRHSNTYYRTDQEYPKKLPLHPDQGRGLPQLAQNLPLLAVPHAHVHSSLAGLGWPHSAQNLPVLPLWPQAHVQPPAAGAGCAAAC